MAGSSPAMTKKRKVDDAHRPTTANAIGAFTIILRNRTGRIAAAKERKVERLGDGAARL
jgi:hypothetical protein